MKVDALWITAPGKIDNHLIEINDEPLYDEIQVEIKACGICSWDRAIFKGVSIPEPFPFMHGHEGVGYVIKKGDGVHDINVGDLVMCTEDAPQMIQVQNIKRSAVAVIEKQVQEKDFPLWVGEPITCVVNSLANTRIQPGAKTVLIGPGYMGLLYIQGLTKTLIGDLTVFGTNQRLLNLAQKFGANETYSISSELTANKIREIKELGGAELIIECSGSESGFQLANDLTSLHGTIVMFAWHRTNRVVNMTPWHKLGTQILNIGPTFDRHYQDHVKETEILMRKGVFDQNDLITHVSDYHHAQEIMNIASTKEDGYIKGVITF